ncbi:ABC transporter ATP-binding protein [Streptosporangium sp. CA-115845]|uniref:ABC transporter ATP-binding protein n=1 Tax=Streptosporangium sp. CA-115845 TaxID=3240071 RepID=UPI003D8BCC91
MTPTPEIALRLDSLAKSYGNVTAVDSIALDVHTGEFLTLLGSSGSGKSTTLMMVAGFETPTSGRILLNDRDVVGIPPHRRELGVVFQSYALFPHMSALDNVAYPLRMRGVAKQERRARAMEALEGVQLAAGAARRPSELSGGQQQRVALARALITDPRVLLMDEPLGALDKKLREHMQIELRRLHRERGVTVVYVTHDQDEALSLSDRIAVMRDGRIEQVGAPREIYAAPATRFVADFIGEATLLEGRVAGAAGDDLYDVRTTEGRVVQAASARAFAKGDAVVVMIRPEVMRLGGDGSERVGVRVVDVGYFGSELRYECRTADGATVIVRELAERDHRPVPVGQETEARWAARDSILISA